MFRWNHFIISEKDTFLKNYKINKTRGKPMFSHTHTHTHPHTPKKYKCQLVNIVQTNISIGILKSIVYEKSFKCQNILPN